MADRRTIIVIITIIIVYLGPRAACAGREGGGGWGLLRKGAEGETRGRLGGVGGSWGGVSAGRGEPLGPQQPFVRRWKAEKAHSA